ncbi:MAG TPA: hypothetical protein VL400_15595 [Polyangiaceae bacterium]|jgi:hypothetical protein|nr:hypothetical protein [Polyangiaceae bacterium]
MQVERRVCRSVDPILSLSLFLSKERARRGAKALVVGTLDGRLVACAGGVDGSLVAAAAALRLHGLPDHAAFGAGDTFVMSVIDGEREPLVLAAVGGDDTPGMTEPHVTRILAS